MKIKENASPSSRPNLQKKLEKPLFHTKKNESSTDGKPGQLKKENKVENPFHRSFFSKSHSNEQQPFTEPYSIIDFDSKYFKIVSGRSKHKVKPFCSYQYRKTINNNLRRNVLTGYLYDEIQKTHRQFEFDRKKLKEIKDKFAQVVVNFKKSLEYDYAESTEILNEAKKEEEKNLAKKNELLTKEKEITILKSEFFSLQDYFDKCNMCMTFIQNITPDYANRGVSDDSELMAQDLTLKPKDSLENLSIQFNKIGFDKQRVPKLYFNSPNEILDLFLNLEFLNGKIMVHSIDDKIQVHTINDSVNILEHLFQKEIKILTDTVQSLELGIRECQKKANNLKQRAQTKLMEEIKYFSIIVEEILMNSQLESTFNYLFKNQDASTKLKILYISVAAEYKALMNQIDQVPRYLYFQTMRKVETAEKKKIKDGRVAKQRLSSIKRIAIQTAAYLERSELKPRRKLLYRSYLTELEERYLPRFRTKFSKINNRDKYLFSDEKGSHQSKSISPIGTIGG